MQKLTPLGDATAGAAAAVFANAVVYPLDVIASRLQVPKDPTSTSGKTRLTLASLYAGLLPSLTQSASSAFAYFFIYTFIRRTYLKQSKGKTPSTAAELILGALAGAISRAFTTPLSVIATRQQTSTDATTTASKDSLSLAYEIISKEGVPALWRGFPASLVLTVNPALTYGLFERVQGIVLRGKSAKSMSPGESFLIGAITKAIATIVTYPYIMAKVRMQWRPVIMNSDIDSTLTDEKTREALTYKNATDVLTKVFQSEGILGWYAGLEAQLAKAILCQGILFMTKDWFTSLFLQLYNRRSEIQ
ncbi:mitochondrial carrier domain-containing protein [Obelidium mucronatum]|nr:mitochondrial carrier domain-containing protein [Obelidium mucronatum]